MKSVITFKFVIEDSIGQNTRFKLILDQDHDTQFYLADSSSAIQVSPVGDANIPPLKMVEVHSKLLFINVLDDAADQAMKITVPISVSGGCLRGVKSVPANEVKVFYRFGRQDRYTEISNRSFEIDLPSFEEG